jgi:hypothetical protein
MDTIFKKEKAPTAQPNKRAAKELTTLSDIAQERIPSED